MVLAGMGRGGVRDVVHMAGVGVDRGEGLPLGRLERALEGSGMAFTHLRPNWRLVHDHAAAWMGGAA